MNVNELEEIKNEIINKYQLYDKKIEALKKHEYIQKFLQYQNQFHQLKAYQEYLKKLEIGEDGTLFSSEICEPKNEYGLKFLFNSALTLKYLHSDKMPNTGLKITVEELLMYLKNADSLLKRKKKYDDDLRENNPYNLEIIKNPSKNKVLKDTEYQELLKGLQNSLKNDYLYSILKKYNVPSQIIYKKDLLSKPTMFLVLARNIKHLEFVDPNLLTKREEDAFFGEQAKKIL